MWELLSLSLSFSFANVLAEAKRKNKKSAQSWAKKNFDASFSRISGSYLITDIILKQRQSTWQPWKFLQLTAAARRRSREEEDREEDVEEEAAAAERATAWAVLIELDEKWQRSKKWSRVWGAWLTLAVIANKRQNSSTTFTSACTHTHTQQTHTHMHSESKKFGTLHLATLWQAAFSNWGITLERQSEWEWGHVACGNCQQTSNWIAA